METPEPETDFISKKKKLNWNTLLLSINLAVVGFAAKEGWQELGRIHDAVLGFNFQITELRTKVVALSLDFEKWKDRHP